MTSLGQLIVVAGSQAGAVFSLSSGSTYAVGRAADAQIALTDLRGRREARVRCGAAAVSVEPESGRVIWIDLRKTAAARVLENGNCIRFDGSPTMLLFTDAPDGLVGYLEFVLAIARTPTMRLNHAFGALQDCPALISLDDFYAPRDEEPPISERVSDAVSHAAFLGRAEPRIDALMPETADRLRAVAYELSQVQVLVDAGVVSEAGAVDAAGVRDHIVDAMRHLIAAQAAIRAARDLAERVESDLELALSVVTAQAMRLQDAERALGDHLPGSTLDDFREAGDGELSLWDRVCVAADQAQFPVGVVGRIAPIAPDEAGRVRLAADELGALQRHLIGADAAGGLDVGLVRERIAAAAAGLIFARSGINALLGDPEALLTRLRRAR